MIKKIFLSTILIFIIWSILDFLIHGILLKNTYENTANLWCNTADIKIILAYFISLLAAFGFVLIYKFFITTKSIVIALKFSLIYGLVAGINMGFGTYAYMPICLYAYPYLFSIYLVYCHYN